MTSKVNYSRYGYFFVAPFIIAFVVFTLYSIIFTVQISFTNLTNWRLDEMSPVGIENYKLLLDPSTPVGFRVLGRFFKYTYHLGCQLCATTAHRAAARTMVYR